MPIDYTGNPAAVDAPDAAPGPENFPTSRLPVDGDALNATSIQQAVKAPDNHIAWLKRPLSRPSQWPENLRTYRNARGQRRFKIDHFALPHGSYAEWTELWTPRNDYLLTGPEVNEVRGRWNINLTNGLTVSTSIAPGIVANANSQDIARALQLNLDGTGAGNVGWYRLHEDHLTSLFTANAMVRLSIDFTAADVAAVDWRLGFMMGAGETIDNIDNGVYFVRPDSPGVTWRCRTVIGGVETESDSGVAGTADVRHLFEIYLVGSAVDDASVNRALFIIDGTPVANHPDTLPITSPANQAAPMFGGVTTGGGGVTRGLVGPVKYSQITAQATP